MPASLNAIISRVVVLQSQPLKLDTPINAYRGHTFFITKQDVVGGILTVTIDDQGPPIALNVTTPFVGVRAVVTYRSTHALSETGSIAGSGTQNPLILTAVLNVPTTGKYGNNTEVVPVVSEWATQADGLEFVVVQSTATTAKTHQLRWFATPIDSNATSQARVIPWDGSAVQGPFGIETP